MFNKSLNRSCFTLYPRPRPFYWGYGCAACAACEIFAFQISSLVSRGGTVGDELSASFKCLNVVDCVVTLAHVGVRVRAAANAAPAAGEAWTQGQMCAFRHRGRTPPPCQEFAVNEMMSFLTLLFFPWAVDAYACHEDCNTRSLKKPLDCCSHVFSSTLHPCVGVFMFIGHRFVHRAIPPGP